MFSHFLDRTVDHGFPTIHADHGDRADEPALPRHMAEREPARRRVQASRQSARALIRRHWENTLTDSGRRPETRVFFEKGIKAHIMGIDGTWRRS